MPKTAVVKVFMVDDSTWYAGETAEIVSAAYRADVGNEAADDNLEWGKPEELTEEQMHRMIFHDGTEERCFRAQLDLEIESGQEFPCMFASTDY